MQGIHRDGARVRGVTGREYLNLILKAIEKSEHYIDPNNVVAMKIWHETEEELLATLYLRDGWVANIAVNKNEERLIEFYIEFAVRG